MFSHKARLDKTGLTEMMGCRVTHMQNSTPGIVPPAWQSHHKHFFDKDQLYDLENDPDEKSDLQREHPDQVSDLLDQLATWRNTAPGPDPDDSDGPGASWEQMSATVRQRLKDLGYSD